MCDYRIYDNYEEEGESVCFDEKRNKIYRLGRIYQKVPLIRMKYNRIREKIALLMPGDIVTINYETTMIVTRSLLKGLLTLLVSLLLAGGDLYFSLAGVMVSYLVFTQSYRGMIERKEIRILTQFADFLEDIQHYYHDMHLIDDAIYAAMEHVEKDLAPYISRLYGILKSPNISFEVEKYAQSSPSRFFTILASICVSKRIRDKKTEQGGSIFLRDLNYLREEVLIELNRKEQINYLFRSLAQISLFPLILIKPIEFWVKNMIEGMANIYNGLYGLIAMLVIFFITFFCYTLIYIYKDDDKGQLIEDSICNLIAIDSVGIEAAFDEIQTERDYYKDKRRLDNQKILSQKATRARRAAFLPLFSVISLYLFAPIIITAIQLLLSLVAATSI